MVDLKESFHESIIIKRAQRRLIGAITILIILFTLSLFFVKDSDYKNTGNEIKVSFLEMGPASFNDKNFLEQQESFKKNSQKLERKAMSVKVPVKENLKFFTVQIGIFSDEEKTKKLSNQIKKIGVETRIKKIKLSGQEKIKLTTQFFKSEREAQGALRKLKNANFPGLIKRN
tara:strand:- start:907 stop:1425 length:519 start_codon:yes stop_codon:yes gene_type:complete